LKRRGKMLLTHLYLYSKSLLSRLGEEKGANLGEYALLLAFIAIVAVGAVTFFGLQLGDLWRTIAEMWPAPGS